MTWVVPGGVPAVAGSASGAYRSGSCRWVPAVVGRAVRVPAVVGRAVGVPAVACRAGSYLQEWVVPGVRAVGP